MWLVLLLVGVIIFLMYRIRKKKYLKYKCFLLTLKSSEKRMNTFLAHHDPAIPVEIIYSVDTKSIENAKKYESIIDPAYFKEAVQLHYGKSNLRTDMTFFNLGAIGCYM